MKYEKLIVTAIASITAIVVSTVNGGECTMSYKLAALIIGG